MLRIAGRGYSSPGFSFTGPPPVVAARSELMDWKLESRATGTVRSIFVDEPFIFCTGSAKLSVTGTVQAVHLNSKHPGSLGGTMFVNVASYVAGDFQFEDKMSLGGFAKKEIHVLGAVHGNLTVVACGEMNLLEAWNLQIEGSREGDYIFTGAPAATVTDQILTNGDRIITLTMPERKPN